MIQKIGNPEKLNNQIIKKIKNTKIDLFYLKNKSDFRDKILENINADDSILDIGKGMREKYIQIKSKNIETLDVNEFDDYPNIIFDLCDNLDPSLKNKYNKIICLAVLEHVYNPFKAVENLKGMLTEEGSIYGYVPFLYHYHAPESLKFQDYFRFSKDA